MEGLIPMVYKVIKRNKVRRQYRCLSVSAAQTYNISDFYDYGNINENEHEHEQGGTFDIVTRSEPRGAEFDVRSNGHHRRYGSAGEFGYNLNYEDDDVYGVGRNSRSPPKQIMKRYKSHRMFSCITGGM